MTDEKKLPDETDETDENELPESHPEASKEAQAHKMAKLKARHPKAPAEPDVKSLNPSSGEYQRRLLEKLSKRP